MLPYAISHVHIGLFLRFVWNLISGTSFSGVFSRFSFFFFSLFLQHFYFLWHFFFYFLNALMSHYWAALTVPKLWTWFWHTLSQRICEGQRWGVWWKCRCLTRRVTKGWEINFRPSQVWQRQDVFILLEEEAFLLLLEDDGEAERTWSRAWCLQHYS